MFELNGILSIFLFILLVIFSYVALTILYIMLTMLIKIFIFIYYKFKPVVRLNKGLLVLVRPKLKCLTDLYFTILLPDNFLIKELIVNKDKNLKVHRLYINGVLVFEHKEGFKVKSNQVKRYHPIYRWNENQITVYSYKNFKHLINILKKLS